MHLEPLPLTADRLVLRPFTPDDVDGMYAYQQLPEVARYLYRPPRTREQCARIISRLGPATRWERKGDQLLLAVCRRAGTPDLLGEVVLTLDHPQAGQAEIGWITHPAQHGRGYATEAARCLAAAAFDRLGVHRLFARLDTENTGSVRVCERLGMRREAHLVENDRYAGRWGSEYVYAALAHELRR
ncbi:GNAT family N-acetyltransferase [Micromonospora sp. WMMD1102]|uniref:GNAT family N-acetyltransferase n=1 Tax=Micromonospora sp. WMMD1102 TaxID=3016105 RepID=UPI0024156267|nr:GNAT family N-acetyltransferase [Micromonospora sp. WMMD1102]MDG4790270.1 GNAT family N-acetyltransferase [Micromonospora sp. WMMD1102]